MDHKTMLTLYCRLCGRRNIADNPLRTIQSVKDVASVIQMLHEIDIKSESEEMYPKTVCYGCYKKFSVSPDSGKDDLFHKVETASINIGTDPDGIKKLARLHPISDFWAHVSVDCQICDDPMWDSDGLHKMLETVKSFSRKPKPTITSLATPLSGRTNSGERPKSSSALQPSSGGKFALKEMLPKQSAQYRISVIGELLKTFQKEKAMKIMGQLEKNGIWLNQNEKNKISSLNVQTDCKRVLTTLLNLPLSEMIENIIKFVTDELVQEHLILFSRAAVGLNTKHSRLAPFLAKSKTTVSIDLTDDDDASSKQNTPTKGLIPTRGQKRTLSVAPVSKSSPKVFKAANGSALTIVKSASSSVQISPLLKNNSAITVNKITEKGNNTVPRVTTSIIMNRVRLSPPELEVKKKKFHAMLPPVRAMRIDIVRYLLLNAKAEKRNMLTRVGINFSMTSGSYLCESGFSIIRGQTYEKELASLVDVQWAVIMAEVVFKLAHPKDFLSLLHIGIKLDANNGKVPMWFRLHNEMNKFITSNFNNTDDSTPTLCCHLVKTLDLKAIPAHIKAVESVLDCDPVVAEAFITKGLFLARSPLKRQKKQVSYTEPDEDDVVSIVEENTSGTSTPNRTRSSRTSRTSAAAATPLPVEPEPPKPPKQQRRIVPKLVNTKKVPTPAAAAPAAAAPPPPPPPKPSKITKQGRKLKAQVAQAKKAASKASIGKQVRAARGPYKKKISQPEIVSVQALEPPAALTRRGRPKRSSSRPIRYSEDGVHSLGGASDYPGLVENEDPDYYPEAEGDADDGLADPLSMNNDMGAYGNAGYGMDGIGADQMMSLENGGGMYVKQEFDQQPVIIQPEVQMSQGQEDYLVEHHQPMVEMNPISSEMINENPLLVEPGAMQLTAAKNPLTVESSSTISPNPLAASESEQAKNNPKNDVTTDIAQNPLEQVDTQNPETSDQDKEQSPVEEVNVEGQNEKEQNPLANEDSSNADSNEGPNSQNPLANEDSSNKDSNEGPNSQNPLANEDSSNKDSNEGSNSQNPLANEDSSNKDSNEGSNSQNPLANEDSSNRDSNEVSNSPKEGSTNFEEGSQSQNINNPLEENSNSTGENNNPLDGPKKKEESTEKKESKNLEVQNPMLSDNAKTASGEETPELYSKSEKLPRDNIETPEELNPLETGDPNPEPDELKVMEQDSKTPNESTNKVDKDSAAAVDSIASTIETGGQIQEDHEQIEMGKPESELSAAPSGTEIPDTNGHDKEACEPVLTEVRNETDPVS